MSGRRYSLVPKNMTKVRVETKKSQKVMDEEMPKLKEGIMNNGYDETLANEIIKMIEPFVG